MRVVIEKLETAKKRIEPIYGNVIGYKKLIEENWMKKLVENIFELNRYIKISIQLLVDGFLICVSLLSAWFIRLEQTSFFFTAEIKTTLIILIPLTLFLFYRLSFYKNIVRFISISFIKNCIIWDNYFINFYLFNRLYFRSIFT